MVKYEDDGGEERWDPPCVPLPYIATRPLVERQDTLFNLCVIARLLPSFFYFLARSLSIANDSLLIIIRG